MKRIGEIFEEVLTERLMDVDSDVDLIYDLYYKRDFDEIERTGNITENMFKESTTSTSILKTPLAIKGHNLNPCSININKSSNFYRPNTSYISVSINRSAINYIIDNGGYDNSIEVAANELPKSLRTSLIAELRETSIKGSIHHELTHWLDDTLHNKHIENRLDRAHQGNPLTKGGKSIDSDKMEIQSQIHNIKQLNNKYGDTWDDISFEEMIKLSPALSKVHRSLKDDEIRQWVRDIKTRMHREGLLGKKMVNNI
jgi:hypothetical protein